MPPKSPSTSRRNLLPVHDGPETADSERTHKGLWPFSRMSDKTQTSLLLLMLYVSVITSCILLILMPQPDSLVATLSKYVLAVVMGSAFANAVNLYYLEPLEDEETQQYHDRYQHHMLRMNVGTMLAIPVFAVVLLVLAW